jgi:hypothetical protein
VALLRKKKCPAVFESVFPPSDPIRIARTVGNATAGNDFIKWQRVASIISFFSERNQKYDFLIDGTVRKTV